MTRYVRRTIIACLLITLAGCGNGTTMDSEENTPEGSSSPNEGEKKIPTLSPDEVEKQLYSYSSTLYDAVAVRGRTGESDSILASPCGGDWNDLSIYSLTHLWQLDEVTLKDQHEGVRNLHGLLRENGWEITEATLVKEEEWEHEWSSLRATHHEDGYSMRAETITDLDRIGFSVSSPCTHLPEGAREPRTKDAEGTPGAADAADAAE